MKKTTQKAIKEMVYSGIAEDITRYDFETMKRFIENHSLEKVMYSYGTYGINGGVLKDVTTGKFYGITKRNTVCLMVF